jgi:tRNA pseudouridine55 synthase
MEGIFAIYKPKGITSYDVIRNLKKITKIEKIGHAGTLDPLAEGILVVAIGSKYTKELNSCLFKNKKYSALVYLGEISTTDDSEGEKNKVNIKSIPSRKKIEEILINFIGDVKQRPPIYSAIKINGIRAYKLARSGQNVKMKERKVEIKDIIIKKYKYPYLFLEVSTGPGVYIRSLARDIGKKLETGAYLKKLIRTEVGNFNISKSVSISDFEKLILKK